MAIPLADVLMFATGCNLHTVYGIDPLTIEFTEWRFPSANTCTNQLNLPLFIDNSVFEENVFCIVNAAGFGNVYTPSFLPKDWQFLAEKTGCAFLVSMPVCVCVNACAHA